MRKWKRVLLVGGGTGGHIIPNLAIATELKKLNPAIELLAIGSQNPLDAALYKAAGVEFKSIFTGKWRRYFSLRNFTDPFLILVGFFQSLYHLIRFWPSVIFSKGGYVSLPVILAAFLLRRPIVMHESDAVMGLSNRITAFLATRILSAFPLRMPSVVLGNPVRSEILHGNKAVGYQLTGFNPQKPIILFWGGSQGAQAINEMLLRDFDALKSTFQIIHITGQGKSIPLQDPHYASFDYLGDELKHIYAITDIVVGRAGANSLFELALVGKPNILIPIQKVDQKANADYFEAHGASLIFREGHSFKELLSALWHNPAQLESMKIALKKLATPDAAKQIAQLLLDYLS